jgi:hypothetical protein
MRGFHATLALAIFWNIAAMASPRLQLVGGGKPQPVFSGSEESINLCWRNVGSSMDETEIRFRIMQLTSATAVRVGEAPWKKLKSLSGQTILEKANLEFPVVKAETHFLVQWVDGSSNVLGTTEVIAYPTNLLSELGVLVNHADGALGVYDPENQLKSSLKNLNVAFVDLENTILENFHGKLAVIGPFDSGTPDRSILTAQIKALSGNGVAVVWVRSAESNSPHGEEVPQPSFYLVAAKQAATVVVQPQMVANLPKNPRSQLNLIYFCKLALKSQPFVLPEVLPPKTYFDASQTAPVDHVR